MRRAVILLAGSVHGITLRLALCLAQPALETVTLEKGDHRFIIDRSGNQRLRHRHHVPGQIAIGFYGDQFLCLRQPVQCAPQVVANRTADIGGMRNHAIERTVFRQPFHGCLGADLVDARYVVDGVADQRQVIDNALGRHPEFGDHAGDVERFIAHGIDQRYMIVDQLRKILVAGRHDRFHSMFDRLHHERADHIVGLDAVDHQDRPAKRTHGLMYRLDLARQVVRH